MNIPPSMIVAFTLASGLLSILAILISVLVISSFRDNRRDLRKAQEMIDAVMEHVRDSHRDLRRTQEMLADVMERVREISRRLENASYASLGERNYLGLAVSDRFYFENREIESIVENIAEENGIALTQGAMAMLIVPMMESRLRRKDVSMEKYRQSVEMLLRFAAREGLQSELSSRERDAIAVIQGFSRYFCNIPPFCAPDRAYR